MGRDFQQVLQQGMTVPPEDARLQTPLPEPLSARIAALYDRMASAYSEEAGRLHIDCADCEDSCCRELFFHYTLTEFLYLSEGLRALPGAERHEILRRANETRALHSQGELRALCPANRDTRCIVYAHRPMICRLHGVPFVLRRRGQQDQVGTACRRYMDRNDPAVFDRTPFYEELAAIEVGLRTERGFMERIRMTVADMIAAAAAPA